MTTSYTPAQPGTWLLLATENSVLFTESPAATAVDELWQALGSAAPVQSILDILSRGGLSTTPSFALGHLEGGSLHALVRGPLVLQAGAESVDGTGVSTWRETTMAGATALSAGDHTGHLPLGSGAVWASGFAFQPAGAVQAAAAAITTPAPVAVPVPSESPAAAAGADVPAERTIVEHTMVEHTAVERDEDPVVPLPPIVEAPVAAGPAYSHLFEETVHRSIEEAAIREPEEVDEEAPRPAPAEVLGDHDGETVMSADIAALRARKRAVAPVVAAPPARSVYLELPNAQHEPLTQPVIIGRNPSVSQVSGTELPRLVSIPGSQDISRSHARFALEGDTVVVTDLHSRNGTTIALPGKPPQLLRKGEPTAVLPGTVVDLGGVISLTVRES